MEWFRNPNPPADKLLFSGVYYNPNDNYVPRRQQNAKQAPESSRKKKGRSTSPKRKPRNVVLQMPFISPDEMDLDVLPPEPEPEPPVPAAEKVATVKSPSESLEDYDSLELAKAIRDQDKSKMKFSTAIDYILKKYILPKDDYNPVDWTDCTSAKSYLRKADFLAWLRDFIYDQGKQPLANYSKTRLYSDILRNINDTFFQECILPEFCTRALQLNSVA